MSRRALNHLARSLVEVLAEDEQREQQMQAMMQQALQMQASQPPQQQQFLMGAPARPMMMMQQPGMIMASPFMHMQPQQPVQFQQTAHVEEVVPKAPSQAAASPLAGRGVVEEVGGRGAGPVDSRAAAAAGHAASSVPVSPVIEEPEPTSPAGPPESSEAILAPRYRSATVEGCSAKSAPPVPRAFTVAASEGEGSSRVSEGTRFLSMIFFNFPNFLFQFFRNCLTLRAYNEALQHELLLRLQPRPVRLSVVTRRRRGKERRRTSRTRQTAVANHAAAAEEARGRKGLSGSLSVIQAMCRPGLLVHLGLLDLDMVVATMADMVEQASLPET